jgi:hypothetical protein
VAAVIYADSGDSREALSGTEAIEILVVYASKVLDLKSGAKAARSTSEFGPERAEKLRESISTPPAATPPPSPTPPPAVTPPPEPTPVPQMQEEETGTVLLDSTDLDMPSGPTVEAPSGPPSAPPVEAEKPPAKDHEDAKRFARLLVSEIKLYNEAKVEEGRKNKDIYDQLKDDIERSRKLYSERYPGAPPGYFNEELVRVLAGGDEGALGQSL